MFGDALKVVFQETLCAPQSLPCTACLAVRVARLRKYGTLRKTFLFSSIAHALGMPL